MLAIFPIMIGGGNVVSLKCDRHLCFFLSRKGAMRHVAYDQEDPRQIEQNLENLILDPFRLSNLSDVIEIVSLIKNLGYLQKYIFL